MLKKKIIEPFTKKIVKKLLKIWSWDPGSGKNLFRIPDPGSRGQKAPNPGSRIPDPGSGSATLLVTEYIRFSKAFKGSVHFVPFLPPPLGGTNDPELIRAMLDVLSWLEKLQKWDVSAYYNAYRAQIYATGTGTEQTGQNTQRHKMPKSYDAYNDKVFICHPWTGIGSELPAMDEDAERVMILELMEGLASNFKWDLDVKPTVDRQQAAGPAQGQNVDRIGTEVLLIGGSNCQQLYAAIADQGVLVESVDSPG